MGQKHRGPHSMTLQVQAEAYIYIYHIIFGTALKLASKHAKTLSKTLRVHIAALQTHSRLPRLAKSPNSFLHYV